MSELKPCRFCGGRAKFRYVMPLGFVYCTKCGAAIKPVCDWMEQGDCREEAFNNWNGGMEEQT